MATIMMEKEEKKCFIKINKKTLVMFYDFLLIFEHELKRKIH